MPTQAQLYYAAERRAGERNATFMELVNHPTNPLTREDLAANIARRPALWSRYAGFTEADEVAANMLADLSTIRTFDDALKHCPPADEVGFQVRANMAEALLTRAHATQRELETNL